MFETESIEYIHDVRKRVGQSMYGLDNVTGILLTALITGGHVLLEGNPGLGKTALVRALGAALGLGGDRIGRIQFTPDLMPADITGTERPVRGAGGAMELKFSHGPIFHWLLIADEINRATPKTQAAMLEAMAERQVTVLGETRAIAAPRTVMDGASTVEITPPFLVMATQNPIDQEGTYDLPEAQSDRFMFKVRMPFPDLEVLEQILEKDAGAGQFSQLPEPEQGAEDRALVMIEGLRLAVRNAKLPGRVKTHILNIVLASNGVEDERMQLSRPQLDRIRAFRETYLSYPVGPRAGASLMLATKGWSAAMMMKPEDETITEAAADALLRISLPVLRHRLKFAFGWERRFDEEFNLSADVSEEDARDRAIAEFASLCAPGDDHYREMIRGGFNAALAYQI